MIERRKTVRQRSFLGARIEYQRTRTHDCMVRNVSYEGARLVCSSTAVVPHLFDLYFPSQGERRAVRMMWRNEEAIGVMFTDVRSTDQARWHVQLQSEVSNILPYPAK